MGAHGGRHGGAWERMGAGTRKGGTSYSEVRKVMKRNRVRGKDQALGNYKDRDKASGNYKDQALDNHKDQA